jgi:hypothetical protein
MKFCPVVPEICRGQVHASQKERIRIIIIKIIRNGAKTISLQTLFNYWGKNAPHMIFVPCRNSAWLLWLHI